MNEKIDKQDMGFASYNFCQNACVCAKAIKQSLCRLCPSFSSFRFLVAAGPSRVRQLFAHLPSALGRSTSASCT